MPPQWRCSPTSLPKCLACACGQKTTLRAPRWRSSRASAPRNKTSPAAQWTGGHRRVATRKTTGDPASHGGASDPETADGGIRMRRPEKRSPSRRALSHSTVIGAVQAEQGYLQPSLSRLRNSTAPQPCPTFPGARTRSAEVPPDLPCTSKRIKGV